MNIVMWILAGGVLGCVGYSYLGFNEDLGIAVSAACLVLGEMVYERWGV
jgi:hypothetical protein